jgi:predicted O-methyltransferase YrrM
VKFYYLSKYLKYIFQSANRRGHGIHSPFVFNLIFKVFRNKISSDIVCKIEMIRKKLVTEKTIIEVTDFGAGSVMSKFNFRKVSEIAAYSSVPEKYGRLLYGLSTEFGNQLIIEFGTSLGISTMYMAAGNQKSVVYTMEGSPSISEIAKRNFAEAGLQNIESHTGPFEKLLPEIEERKISPGLVFIDGNHRREPTIEYFNRMAALADINTVIVIDDINYSPEMGEAWNEIKRDERVSFTVDIFRMGLVFFREGMTPCDYIIRY